MGAGGGGGEISHAMTDAEIKGDVNRLLTDFYGLKVEMRAVARLADKEHRCQEESVRLSAPARG